MELLIINSILMIINIALILNALKHKEWNKAKLFGAFLACNVIAIGLIFIVEIIN